jgi:hypothetical protein
MRFLSAVPFKRCMPMQGYSHIWRKNSLFRESEFPVPIVQGISIKLLNQLNKFSSRWGQSAEVLQDSLLISL